MSVIIKDLGYIYSPGTPFEYRALHDVTLEIPDGQYVALIGHTGSGKSTLIQHLNGLIRPTSGSITVQGIFDLSAPPAKRAIEASLAFFASSSP